MNVALLSEARRDGVRISLGKPGMLKVAGPAVAVDRWRQRIAVAKPEIIAVLSSAARTAPDPGALMDDFEERAAILEFDAGMSRRAAEMSAWKMVYGGGD